MSSYKNICLTYYRLGLRSWC